MPNVFQMSQDPQGFYQRNPGQPNVNWTGQPNSMSPQQMNNYGNYGYQNTRQPSRQSIPVRVVFSPDQISPQEIPTDGTPALFPLNDGSAIIAKFVNQNGLFDENIYVLQPKQQTNQNGEPQPSEFDQVMARLGGIEQSLNKVLGDLYGNGNEPKESEVVSNG